MIGAPHLTVAHEPELDRCIRETHAGQAAWAGWRSPDKTCAECRHFRPGTRHKDEGHCGRYRELMPRDSVVRQFPAKASACREFAP